MVDGQPWALSSQPMLFSPSAGLYIGAPFQTDLPAAPSSSFDPSGVSAFGRKYSKKHKKSHKKGSKKSHKKSHKKVSKKRLHRHKKMSKFGTCNTCGMRFGNSFGCPSGCGLR